MQRDYSCASQLRHRSRPNSAKMGKSVNTPNLSSRDSIYEYVRERVSLGVATLYVMTK